MSDSPVAILGATSHIAKGLIINFIKNNNVELHLYARSINKVEKFIGDWCGKNIELVEIKGDFQDLHSNKYGAIINCVGVGTTNKLSGDYFRYFEVTEKFDDLILGYLKNNPSAVYVNISSGIVYGDSDRGDCTNGKSTISLNDARAREFCIVSNINSGEGTLSKLINREELYDNVNGLVLDARSLLDDVKNNPAKYLRAWFEAKKK